MTRGVAAAGRRFLARFSRDARGATAIEYALIAVGISIVIASATVGIGESLKANFYGKVNTELNR